MLATRHLYFTKGSARCSHDKLTNLITVFAHKNKRNAPMLTIARKDHSIPLYFLQAGSKITLFLTPSRHEIHSKPEMSHSMI